MNPLTFTPLHFSKTALRRFTACRKCATFDGIHPETPFLRGLIPIAQSKFVKMRVIGSSYMQGKLSSALRGFS
jgi:hypothetical protein